MRSQQFWPGDKVMTIMEYNGLPMGSVGRIDTRWMGTTYVVRLPDSTFEWLNSSEFGSRDPSKHHLEVGDFGIVTSSAHQHDFAKVGDVFQVVKVVYDVDFYGVNINNRTHWIGGFRLATYLPTGSP